VGDQAGDHPSTPYRHAVVAYDRPELERWRRQAQAALDLARLAAPTTPSWACFLAEQGAQLALKGLLHAIGEHALAWGHDLGPLEHRVAGVFGGDWPPGLVEPAMRLGRHYLPARYPDAHPTGAPDDRYTAGDARGAVDDAVCLVNAVDEMAARLRAADSGGSDDG
jgi:HEPN domain-containing protein